MADLADVEVAIVSTIVTAVYPAGTESDSVIGANCRVYRGWPNPTALNNDLLSGVVNVSVAPDTDIGRTTTRFALSWSTPGQSEDLAWSVVGETVALTGEPTPGQVTGLLVDGQTFVHPVRDGDTVEMIAANLAAMIRSSRVATLDGNTISILGAHSVVARVVTPGVTHTEVRRQERDTRVACWCASPSVRDAIGREIDAALARLPFLALSDATAARVIYKGTTVYDQAQNSLLYRRDLVYTVEYPTTSAEQLPAMLFGTLGLNEAKFTA
jgi:hypothetical protein